MKLKELFGWLWTIEKVTTNSVITIDKSLKSLGVAVMDEKGEFKNANEVMTQLSEKWSKTSFPPIDYNEFERLLRILNRTKKKRIKKKLQKRISKLMTTKEYIVGIDVAK